jgi:hypothetical protein
MKQESLPSVKSVYEALEGAAVDAYGFALACHGGAAWLAEPILLDVLLVALENVWFTDDDTGRLSHREFREEFFKSLWDRSRKTPAAPGARDDNAPHVRIGTDVPLGHEEMRFYRLPQLARAALFLRTKKHMSYASIALILGSTEGLVRAEVERAREFLLGRRVKMVDWSEDDF